MHRKWGHCPLADLIETLISNKMSFILSAITSRSDHFKSQLQAGYFEELEEVGGGLKKRLPETEEGKLIWKVDPH